MELTINDLKQLLNTPIVPPLETDEGFCLVVLDKGFIYIGKLTLGDKFSKLTNAANLRKFSSGKGLSWHIENGCDNTTLDKLNPNTELKFLTSNIQHWVKTDEKKWY